MIARFAPDPLPLFVSCHRMRHTVALEQFDQSKHF